MKNINDNIFVTRPFLPPLKEFIPYLEEMWKNKRLTNKGPFHQQFEKELADYLGVEYLSLFTNGTLALIIALRVLHITDEVITTPFSFVATTHSLWWNNIQPRFVDIESDFCTLDLEKVESAITSKTTGILPVHVYGYPCQVDQLQEIADAYGLSLLYDAAHAFGVRLRGRSLMEFGDLSVLSFHATKIFNTFEGGAIICHDEQTYKKINHLKNFGIVNETTVVDFGINAKMNEFQAALGLLQLQYIDEIIANRKTIADRYKADLFEVDGISFLSPSIDVNYNYAYFPIFVNSEIFGHTRDELYEHLKSYNYWCRRYFYPLISSFNIYQSETDLPIATKMANSVLCLPIYPDLEIKHVDNILEIITNYKKT